MFKLGDIVTWKSQAQAYSKEKTGEIVQVVPAGERPDRSRFLALYKSSGCGWGRKHESYVVKVGNKYYWPRAKHLKLVKGEKSGRARQDLEHHRCGTGSP